MKTSSNKQLWNAGVSDPNADVRHVTGSGIGDEDGISNRAMNVLIVIFMLLSVCAALTVSAGPPDSVKYRILLRQAMLDMDRLDYDRAITKLLEVRANTPENANVSQMLGVCYLYGRNAPEKAAFYLSRAVGSVSSDHETWDLDEMNAPMRTLYVLGKAYEELKEFSKASDYYGEYLAHISTKKGIERSRMYTMLQRTAADCQLAAERQAGPTVENENVVINK